MAATLQVILPVIIMILTSCSGLEQQSQVENFHDGKMPVILEKLANPKPSKELELTTSQSINNRRLRVAVIDNGVDYLHPRLYSQIDFTRAENAIVGAGWDFLGNDGWASPNTINPSLFAFCAEKVIDGRIVTPPQDPLTHINRFNALFMNSLLEKIQKDPQLKQSLFSQLDTQSLNLYGVIELLNLFPWDEKAKKTYESRKKENSLLYPGKPVPEDLSASINQTNQDVIFRGNWQTSPEHGYPTFAADMSNASLNINYITMFAHADIFFQLLQDQLAEFKKDTDLVACQKTYYDYEFSRVGDKNGTKVKDLAKHLNTRLHQAWYLVKTSFAPVDPAHKLLYLMCHTMDPFLKNKLSSPLLLTQEKSKLVKAMISGYLSQAEAIDKYLLTLETSSRAQRKTSKKNLKQLPKLRQILTSLVNKRSSAIFFCNENNPAAIPPASYQEYARTNLHPYVSDTSKEMSHGTHVSGIIATQDKDIAITPIRISTQSIKSVKNQNQPMLDAYERDLTSWFSNKSFRQAITKDLPQLLGTDGLKLPPTQQGKMIMKKFKPAFLASFEKNPIYFRFFSEMISAVKYVGKREIKIVNMSLGASFESVPTHEGTVDEEESLAEYFEFLIFEYFKYKIKKTIAEHAPGTLFVVAAGNDGNWLDGKSRSGLPCDLSSSWLTNNGDGDSSTQPLISGSPSNILCVGSINKQGDLSAFTNIPITNVPFVLSYGEAILSTIKTTDCSGAAQQFADMYGANPSYPDMSSEPMFQSDLAKKMVVDLGLVPEDLKGEKREKIISQEVTKLAYITQSFIPGLLETAQVHRCINDNEGAAKLTGTSMASPAVAGFIAKWVLGQMREDHLQDHEIYLHQGYTPSAIINKIALATPSFGGSSIISSVRVINNIKEYNRSPAETKPAAEPNIVEASKIANPSRSTGIALIISRQLTTTAINH